MSEHHRAPEQWRPPAPWLRAVLTAILVGLAAVFLWLAYEVATLPARPVTSVPCGTFVSATP